MVCETLRVAVSLWDWQGNTPDATVSVLLLAFTPPGNGHGDSHTAARFDPEVAAPGPHDMDLAGVRESTRKLVALARREGAALVVFGHDAEQWRTLKRAPAYYS